MYYKTLLMLSGGPPSYAITIEIFDKFVGLPLQIRLAVCSQIPVYSDFIR